MTKRGLLLFSLLSTIGVSAQEVVSTQGESYSNSNGSINFTIGEVSIDTGTDGTNDITQGFHQTNWSFLGLEDHVTSFNASIFPNPTSEVLILKISAFNNVHYYLYDAQGKLVLNDIISAEETLIQVGQFAPGNYTLKLNKENQHLKTFKLAKNH